MGCISRRTISKKLYLPQHSHCSTHRACVRKLPLELTTAANTTYFEVCIPTSATPRICRVCRRGQAGCRDSSCHHKVARRIYYDFQSDGQARVAGLTSTTSAMSLWAARNTSLSWGGGSVKAYTNHCCPVTIDTVGRSATLQRCMVCLDTALGIYSAAMETHHASVLCTSSCTRCMTYTDAFRFRKAVLAA
jgi:hypothetical protein